MYDKSLTWLEEKRFIRLRKTRDGVVLTYKQHAVDSKAPAQEVEFPIPSLDAGIELFERTEIEPFRRQQKLRHTLHVGDITFDIDTWPRVPPYVEIEAPSEVQLKEAAALLGLSWGDVVYDDAKTVLEKRYNIPMCTMRWLTFSRFE